MTKGKADQMSNGMKTELLRYVCSMHLNRFDAQDQVLGDLLTGIPIGDECQDFAPDAVFRGVVLFFST